MTDIDFDELDKAINNLVSSDKESPAPAASTATAANPNTIPVNRPATASPSAAPADKPSQPKTEAPATDRPAVLPKRSGRFMDFMHSSTKNRPADEVKVPERPREGMNITPPSQPEEATPKEPTLPTESEPSTNDTPPANPEPKGGSPFIENVSVEKRPLGMPPEASQPEETPASKETNSQPEGADTPLPAELQPGVMSLEADNPQSEKVAAEEESKPAVPVLDSHKQDQKPEDAAAKTAYGNGPFQAVGKAPKKKSGWLWVLWIFLILAIGVGAGAAMYFFVLPIL